MQQIRFHNIGLWLCGVSVCLTFLSGLTALRGFGFGVWPQSETVMAFIHLANATITIGLACLFLGKEKAARTSVIHPLIVLPFFIGLLSLGLMPWHDLPVRSFLGDVRTGEGAVWWMNVAATTWAVIILIQVPFWRKAIVYCAIAAFVVYGMLTLSHQAFEHYYAPLYFADYLAVCILAMMTAAAARWGDPASFGWKSAIFYCAVIVGMYFTGNRAMLAYAVVMPLYFIGLRWLSEHYMPRYGKRVCRLSVMAIPLVFLSFYIGFASVYDESGFDMLETSGILRTFLSRAFFVDISWQAMLNQPASFLIGLGWGRYVDHMTVFQPEQWIDFVHLKTSQWDGYTKDQFHSHNMFMETWTALGTGGLILLITYFSAFAWAVKKRMQMTGLLVSSGLMVWGSFWFMMPVLLPFVALAAALLAGYKRSWRVIRIPVWVMVPLLIVIVGMQIAAAWMILTTAVRNTHFEPTPLTVAQARTDCADDYKDYGAGGLHLSRMMLDRLRYTIDLTVPEPEKPEKEKPEKEKPEAIPGHVKALNSYFCQSATYIAHYQTNERLVLTHLIMRGEVLLGLSDYLDQETKDYYYDGWEVELSRWLSHYPKRIDVATPYLLYNMVIGQEGRSTGIINQIYRQNSDHPVGLWFRGLETLSVDPEEGAHLMRKALNNGIERFIPVDEQVKQMLMTKNN